MGTPTIQCVCGFGCGTSLMLKMLVEDILKDQGLEAEVITGDIATCLSNPSDAILVSRDLGDRIAGRAKDEGVTVIALDNLLDREEVRGKLLPFMWEHG